MQHIKQELILIEARQRSEMDRTKLIDLKESIRERGLFHPLIISSRGKPRLLAGGRRFQALKELHADGIPVFHGETLVPPGTVPCIVLDDPDTLQSALIEYEENSAREDLSWKDEATALAAIYELKKAANVNNDSGSSRREAALEISKLSGNSTPVSTLEVKISRASTISRNLERPEVANARSFHEAYRASVAGLENRFMAEIASRNVAATARAGGVSSLLCSPRFGDARTILPQLDESQFDIILSDPPYGVNADTAFPNSREAKHRYEDNPQYAKEIYKLIITEGFRVCKPKAHLMLFCQIDFFVWLKEFAAQMAWVPFNTPIIWKHQPGSAPWGNLGFRRNYDVLFWAVKGQRGLYKLHEDVIEDYTSRRERSHGAEKPVPLLRKLLDATTLPGERVCDPCMGTGATLLAARAGHRESIGIEKDEGYYNQAVARLSAPEGEESKEENLLESL